jgi:hypothetical protein
MIHILDNIKPEYKKGSDQEEDWLYTALCNDPTIQSYCNTSHPNTKIPAPEWLDCLQRYINFLANNSICYCDMDIKCDEIMKDIDAGKPINVSTTLWGGGHRVSIVGYEKEPARDAPKGYWIADPWLTTRKEGLKLYSLEEYGKVSKDYGIRFYS